MDNDIIAVIFCIVIIIIFIFICIFATNNSNSNCNNNSSKISSFIKINQLASNTVPVTSVAISAQQLKLSNPSLSNYATKLSTDAATLNGYAQQMAINGIDLINTAREEGALNPNLIMNVQNSAGYLSSSFLNLSADIQNLASQSANIPNTGTLSSSLDSLSTSLNSLAISIGSVASS